MTKGKHVDLTGETFGRLKVVAKARNLRTGQVEWLARCACGQPHKAPTAELTSGKVRSCGCLRRELGHEAMRRMQAAKVRQTMILAEKIGRRQSAGEPQV
jgi:hypothetical protein